MKLNFNWQQRLSELVVVFLGVYMAFALNNWKENRKAKDLESRYLRGIVSDLDSDIDYLQEKLDTSRYFQLAVNTFISRLHTKNFESDSATLKQVIALLSVVEFIPNKATFNSLSANGNLAIINDFELNKKITDLYIGQYNNLERIEQNTNNQSYMVKVPYFHEKLKYGKDGIVNKEVFYDTKFFNLAHSSQYFWYEKVKIYEETLQKLKELKEDIIIYLNEKE